MPTPAVPLEDLAQRIARHENQLEALRREYQARQEQLTSLTQRKQELEAELLQVETEIRSIAHGRTPRPSPAAPKRSDAKTSPPPAPDQPTPSGSVPDFIVARVRAANGRPIGLRQMTEEATSQGLTAASRNPLELVRWHAKELVRKHILRRAPKRAGLLLARPKQPVAATRPSGPPDGKPATPRASKTARSSAKPGSAERKAAKPSRSGMPREQRPLREVVLQVLRKSKRPLPARELAKQVLATGYQTGSKDFTNVIWVAVGRMDEVENAPQGGYRLKRAKK